MAEEDWTRTWTRTWTSGLVHVLITAADEASAYRVFDALVERFPGVEAPVRGVSGHGIVMLAVSTPTSPGRPT